VRRIVVTAGDSLEEKNHLARCHPLLADLVRLLPSLRLFSWHATQSIPVSVLQALRCKPSLHVLDLQFYDRTNAESRDKVLANLMPNTKLKSALLELSLNDLQNDEIDLLDMNLVLEKMPIKACQLQTLVLRVSDSLPIDVTLPLPPISWELSHRHNLQSVEDLRIIGPRMGTDIGIFGRITCANLRTLELWNCGDCTELFHSLAEDHSDLKIRTFKIRESQADINANWLNSNDGIEACHGFISSLDGLEELALEGYESTKMECITCHSRTLKKLTWTVRWLSCTEKANALATIRDGCSSLRSLRINEPRARLHRVSKGSLPLSLF